MCLIPYLLVTLGYASGALVGFSIKPEGITIHRVLGGYLLVVLILAVIDVGVWLYKRKQFKEMKSKTNMWPRQ